MISDAQHAVRQFSLGTHLPVSMNPKSLDKARVLLRAKWMQGEIDEFVEAGDLTDQVDAIVDLIYYALGVFVEMGIDGGKAFEIVHAANMEKINSPTGPAYDEDGKVLKPDGWKSPREKIRRWLADLLGSENR